MDPNDTPAPAHRRRRAVQITERDRTVLNYAAEHRLVLAAHVQELLGVSAAAAYARLRALCNGGYLATETVFHRQPAHYQVTRRGLAAAASALPRPRRCDVAIYEHDVGVAWLWLAARRGAFGRLEEIVSERQLRSHDGRLQRDSAEPGAVGAVLDDRPLGVRLGGVGPGGRERLHYPDLLLRTSSGHTVAVELELTSKGRRRRETILSGYGADRNIDTVVYLVGDPGTARAIQDSARRLGISSLVHVQWFRWGGGQRPLARAAERGRVSQPAAKRPEAAR